MAIKKITTEQLRTMNDKEGLVIQGCGSELQEWVDGLNESLNEDIILLNSSRFENGYVFKNDGVTCIFFPFDDVNCDIGKMAVWRIKTHSLFCGTWFTDYVNNRLGDFTEEVQKKKPHCPLENEDGNIFNVMGLATKALRRAGIPGIYIEEVVRPNNLALRYENGAEYHEVFISNYDTSERRNLNRQLSFLDDDEEGF